LLLEHKVKVIQFPISITITISIRVIYSCLAATAFGSRVQL